MIIKYGIKNSIRVIHIHIAIIVGYAETSTYSIELYQRNSKGTTQSSALKVMDIARFLKKTIKVEVKGQQLPVNTFQDYTGLYLQTTFKSKPEGWEEGQGLGKHKQGINKLVKVKKKQDTIGVGVDKVAINWTFNTFEFGNILKKLKVQVVASKVEEENREKQEVKKTETTITISKEA